MSEFGHGPPVEDESEPPGLAARNARYGLILFAVYLLFYGGFVLFSAFAPEQLERTPIAGVNLAILAGFGLIVLAWILALVYGWLCRAQPAPNGRDEDPRR